MNTPLLHTLNAHHQADNLQMQKWECPNCNHRCSPCTVLSAGSCWVLTATWVTGKGTVNVCQRFHSYLLKNTMLVQSTEWHSKRLTPPHKQQQAERQSKSKSFPIEHSGITKKRGLLLDGSSARCYLCQNSHWRQHRQDSTSPQQCWLPALELPTRTVRVASVPAAFGLGARGAIVAQEKSWNPWNPSFKQSKASPGSGNLRAFPNHTRFQPAARSRTLSTDTPC